MPRASTPNTPGRTRRLTGWFFLILALLTAAAWAASGEWAVEYGSDRRGIRLWNGTLYTWTVHNVFDSPTVFGVLAVIERPNSEQLHISSSILNLPEPAFSFTTTNLDDTWQQRWWFGLGQHDTPQYSHQRLGIFQRTFVTNPAGVSKTVAHSITLWPLALLFSAAAATCLRSSATARRRAALNFCATCGYNLAGLDTTANCPECGRPPNKSRAP